ncbi:hypothetical protein M501DRAFT_1008904 [Patellaria atrata CBS 101060]|uniref:BTB domain-containing protein n=1 Tax=Patellaria atrata CBS 101060 TaxID=1346257 RepID=A0A9P4S293_9PEZI|nr:hypothetical protein M501DRAFT_1008904 [Patellaria atrata CBS 101060]
MDSPAPNNELMSALATLLEAGKYSDLTVLCGSKRYAVHRAIICSRSGFFDGACSNPFRESETGIIDLSEDDPEAVDHMVHYFYHLDYLRNPKSTRASVPTSPVGSPSSLGHRRRPNSSRKINLAFVEDPLLATAAHSAMSSPFNSLMPSDDAANQLDTLTMSEKQPATPAQGADDGHDAEPLEFPFPEQEVNPAQAHLILHAKVYAIAEKYGISGLKSLARKKFASQLSTHYSDPEFADVLYEVYDSTVDSDRGLRDIIIQTFRANPDLARRDDVETCVKESPQLAWELYRMAMGLPI